jgi:alginate O-acetyltransferase complex protein AlgI
MFFKLLAYTLGWLASLSAVVFVRSIRVRQMLLLAVSYAVYLLGRPWFLGVLLFSSICNYCLGAYLKRRLTLGRLWLGIAFNLLLLGIFKYLPGLANTSVSSFHAFGQLILPLGISFWTFQALSYLFDIYREEELEPSLLEFCLYMAFWPTVISGPICRLGDMLPQFRSQKKPLWDDYGVGLRRVAIGFLMLAVAQLLADGLAPGQGINGGFDRMNLPRSALDVWLLAIGYGFQLFMDFAGYSHLVIGAARIFGFESPLSFHFAIGVLDAMAHVAFVLDSGLCIFAAGIAATRPAVAVFRFSNRHDPVRTLASRQFAIYPVGCVSRNFACLASAVAANRAPRGHNLRRICGRDFGMGLYIRRNMPGMDFVSS